VHVTPVYRVRGSASENFVFGPYIRLGEPTYGFVHDFSHMVLDVMVFSPWYLVASICINMYFNIERNIMKNQAGSPSFWIQEKISVYMCFMCYALTLFIFCVLEFICR